MTKKRAHALRITLGDDTQVRTSDDVVYAWSQLGRHEGWTRTHKPDEYSEAPRLLIPKTFDRGLANALLDSIPEDLKDSDLAGAILVFPWGDTPPELNDLRSLRQARIDGTDLPVNDVTLARISTAEILDLVSQHGLPVAARALQLRSLPIRDELLAHLGHQRVAELLAQHPELPEGIVWQAMRSRGFDPTQTEVPAESAVGLAGNPNLSQKDQDEVIRELTAEALAGKEVAIPSLARAVASPSLPETTATWLADQYSDLPRSARLSLASNRSADWLWLRRILDSDLDPEIALASRKVGEVGLTRSLAFTQHPDPAVRAAAGVNLAAPSWSWDNRDHLEVLRLIDDPLSTGEWSLEPAHMDPSDWGAYSVARQWAARTGDHPEAEKELRRLVDLHNRSWGAVGKGQGDPSLAARADGARAVATLTPELQLLGLDEGRTYTLEDARMCMVQATAARPHDDLRHSTSPMVDAVLDACAAEAETNL